MPVLPTTHPFTSAFAEELAQERIRSTREIAVLAAVLYALFAILDIWAIPSALYPVWAVRAVVVLTMVGLFALTHTAVFLRHYTVITVAQYIVLGMGIEAMVYLAGEDDLARTLYYTGLILVVMGLYIFAFLPWWLLAATGFGLVILYVLIAVVIHRMTAAGEWHILLANCFFFVSANIIGLIGAMQRNRYLRESFQSRLQLRQALAHTLIEKEHSDSLSRKDPLTGLANRKALLEALTTSIHDKPASPTRFALLFIDLDGFKRINDNLGHGVGDMVLRIIARRIVHSVRDTDLTARLGGDEFVVMLTLAEDHCKIAERIGRGIIANIERPITDPPVPYRLSASIGIAFYPDHGQDADTLLRVADQAMYRAKRHTLGIAIAATVENGAIGPALKA